MDYGKWRRFLKVVVFLVLILLAGAEKSLAAPKGTLRATIHWGVSADWNDPSNPMTYSGQFNLYLLHDALLKPMPDGLYTPCLAESWKISEDYRVFEFKLRKGVKFHNGDEMTAEDVVFTFWRYKGLSAKLIHDRTEKVEAPDPYLVRVIFKKPFPNFLEFFLTGTSTIGWIVPKKYIQKIGEAEFKKCPIGCGPYKFIEFQPDTKFVVEAFEKFWRKTPPTKRLEFYFVKEPSTRYAMLKNGEVDIATLMTDVLYEKVKNDKSVRMLTPLSPTRWIVYMTSQWDPKSPWADPRVRKAASLAIDRQTLADAHMPGCGPNGSLGLEGDPEAIHFPPDPYDPDRAKKLLAEAGYPNGFHGGIYYPYDGPYWPYGEQVAIYWKAIGIRTDLVLLDRPAWIAKRGSGQMKGTTFIDSITQPTIGGRLDFLFGGIYCYGNYPDIQGLWSQYNQAIDPKIRTDLVGRIQKLIYEKTMYIPLTTTNSPAAFGPRVKGNPYKIQPLIWFLCPMEDIELNE